MKWERNLSAEGGGIIRVWTKDDQELTITVLDDGSLQVAYFPTKKTWAPQYLNTWSIREANDWIKTKTGGELELSVLDIDDIVKRMLKFSRDAAIKALKEQIEEAIATVEKR